MHPFHAVFSVCILATAHGQLLRQEASILNLPAELPVATGFTTENALGTLTLSFPIDAASPPGVSNRLFVLERSAGIQIVNLDTMTKSTFTPLAARRLHKQRVRAAITGLSSELQPERPFLRLLQPAHQQPHLPKGLTFPGNRKPCKLKLGHKRPARHGVSAHHPARRAGQSQRRRPRLRTRRLPIRFHRGRRRTKGRQRQRKAHRQGFPETNPAHRCGFEARIACAQPP